MSRKRSSIDFAKLGEAVRLRRKAVAMTLTELSEQTGVAQATLSRIETGAMPGTVDCHHRIAQALKMPLSELLSVFDEPKRRGEKGEARRRLSVARRNQRVRRELLTAPDPHKNVQPVLMTLEGRSSTEWTTYKSGTEVFFFVLEGNCDVELEGEATQLGKEDSLYLDGTRRHRLVNRMQKRTRVVVVTA